MNIFRRKRDRESRRGFILTEVLIALMILCMLTVVLTRIHLISRQKLRVSEEVMREHTEVQRIVEEIRDGSRTGSDRRESGGIIYVVQHIEAQPVFGAEDRFRIERFRVEMQRADGRVLQRFDVLREAK